MGGGHRTGGKIVLQWEEAVLFTLTEEEGGKVCIDSNCVLAAE